jgi:hypothetical protein
LFSAVLMLEDVEVTTPFVVETEVNVWVPIGFRATSLNTVPSTCPPTTKLPARQL